MVLDVLDNFGKYAALNPYFSLVDAFMRTHQLEELALGTYNIKGEDVVLKIERLWERILPRPFWKVIAK